MAACRVLLVDDNQIFGSQVVTAFAEVGIAATWVAHGSEAMPHLQHGASRPQLLIIDLVRPASGGSWLLSQLQGEDAAARPRPPLALALVPVIGTFHDLPDGVEVQVKPIFPNQVVATARRLLGLAPATGRPTAPGLPALVTGAPPRPQTGSAAVHRVPSLAEPPPIVDTLSDHPTEAHIPHPALDAFEDSSDFGPADTLLAPSNIEELARAMTSGANPALQLPMRSDLRGDLHDDLFDPPLLDATLDATSDAVAEETTSPRAAPRPRPRTRPQFAALSGELPAVPAIAETADEAAKTTISPLTILGEPEGENGETVPLVRTMLPRGAAQPAGDLSGDLSVVPLIDVIALLSRQRQRGILQISDGDLSVSIYWRGGKIDQCTGSGLPEGEGDLRIGRFILEAAALSHAQIDEIEDRRQARPNPGGELLGVRLCQEGLLQIDELRQALSRQSAELLYLALCRKRGRFSFDHRATLPHAATKAELGGGLELDAEALLLEGYRRIHDYHVVDKDAEEGAVYVSTAGALQHSGDPGRQLGLSDSEVVVLGLCNGRLSLAEIARDSRLPLLEVARTVQRLEALHLCRRRLPALLAS